MRFLTGEYWGNEAESPGSELQEWELETPDPGSEAAAIAGLIQQGLLDENKITNAVFYQRHPERGGASLTANETALIREWTAIRDTMVRPPLRALGVTPIDPRPFRALLPLIEKYRGNIPLEFLLGWIAVESGGFIGTLTTLDERGYFQIHPGESAALRIDHRRLSTDPEYSIQKGIELVKFRAANSAKLGFAPGSELYWTVSKLFHWLPLGVKLIVALMRSKGFQPANWAQFRQFVLENRGTILTQLKARPGTGWDPAVGVANVDKTLRRGRQLLQMLGMPAPVSPGSTTRHEIDPEDELLLIG